MRLERRSSEGNRHEKAPPAVKGSRGENQVETPPSLGESADQQRPAIGESQTGGTVRWGLQCLIETRPWPDRSAPASAMCETILHRITAAFTRFGPFATTAAETFVRFRTAKARILGFNRVRTVVGNARLNGRLDDIRYLTRLTNGDSQGTPPRATRDKPGKGFGGPT